MTPKTIRRLWFVFWLVLVVCCWGLAWATTGYSQQPCCPDGNCQPQGVPILDYGGWRQSQPRQQSGMRFLWPVEQSQGQMVRIARNEPAVVRVDFLSPEGGANVGSGMIVGRNGTVAAVLTCAHGYRVGHRVRIVSGGKNYFARVVHADALQDILVCEIVDPGIEPVVIELDTEPSMGEPMTAEGFVGGTRYHRVAGALYEWSSPTPSGSPTFFALRAKSHGGMSGGPIRNAAGKVVGLVTGGFTDCNGPCFPRLRKLLRRILPPYSQPRPLPNGSGGVANQKPDKDDSADLVLVGEDPSSPTDSAAEDVRKPDSAAHAVDTKVDTKLMLDALSRIENFLTAREQEASEPGGGVEAVARLDGLAGKLESVEQTQGKVAGILQALADRPAAQAVDESKLAGSITSSIGALLSDHVVPTAATSTVGSLLPTIALGAGGATLPTVLVWLMIRRLRKKDAADETLVALLRKRLSALASTPTAKPTGAAATPAVDFPQAPPRDTTEAEQLLRLARLEGRDPILDGLVGTLIFDELQNLMDKGGDEASWASSLKRTLDQRVNQIAPLSVKPVAAA